MIVTPNQIVSIRNARGVLLDQLLPSEYSEITWSRDQRDASRCDLTIPPQLGIDRLPDLAPWVHWITVWDGDRNLTLWDGPIQMVEDNARTGVVLTVKDHAAYLDKTRTPMTKRWDAADPAWIAGELWERMIDHHAIRAEPVIRPDPEGERFDFQTTTDEQLLGQTIKDLVDIGLKWQIVSGVPILGPLGLEPIATLSESDFLGDGVSVVRDGKEIINDLVVRGSDNLARAIGNYHGQSLQGIKTVDSLSGASNVTRAAQTYIKQLGVARTRLKLADDTILHPDAPVTIDQLMPSARVVLEARGIRQLMELTSVEVTRRAGANEVKVTLESVLTTQEKLDLELDNEIKAPEVTMGGAATR